jgi:CMP-N-acetylneuraminic acid synthetase
MLAIIPARGGSVGLPGKNILPLCGIPLIGYTIRAAVDSGIFDKIIVSTDDEQIAKVSRSFGADVPFLRPRELATSEAKSMDVHFHALEWLKEKLKYIPDNLTVLQPTSPLRDASTIRKAYQMFKDCNAKRLVGVSESKDHFYWTFSLDNKKLSPLSGKFHLNLRRQDLPKSYTVNGSIYIGELQTLLQEGDFLGPDTIGFIMPRIKSVDIDDIVDFNLAETLLEKVIGSGGRQLEGRID